MCGMNSKSLFVVEKTKQILVLKGVQNISKYHKKNLAYF